ncbi:hypothetical protein Z043_112808, partial [Scleropages formosus]
VMLAASYWSLLAPAIDMAEDSGKYGAFAFVPVAVGFTLGAAFVYFADLMMPMLAAVKWHEWFETGRNGLARFGAALSSGHYAESSEVQKAVEFGGQQSATSSFVAVHLVTMMGFGMNAPWNEEETPDHT